MNNPAWRFISLRNDLRAAREDAVERGAIRTSPCYDYTISCDPDNYALLQTLANVMAGRHSYMSFAAAIMNYTGTFEQFMTSNHVELAVAV